MTFLRLKYSSLSSLPGITASFDHTAFAPDCDLIVSFRKAKLKPRSLKHRRVHAGSRFKLAGATRIALAYLEEDSPLAVQICWDYLNALTVGGQVQVIASKPKTYFDLTYPAQFMTRIGEHRTGNAYLITYEKNQPTSCEAQAGLDAWSFCIPTGGDDASFLNAAVERILALDIAQKEIVLCGTPGANFRFPNEVRVIPDPCKGGPLFLGAKKNALARAAAHQNLCIVHDRLLLPTDFLDAIKRYGDGFGFATLPSLYFEDHNMSRGYRYSDYHSMGFRGRNLLLATDTSVSATQDDFTTPFAPALVPATCANGQFRYTPLYDRAEFSYATGSLYICKQSTWLTCSQHEALSWDAYEDVEHAYRALKHYGIPSHILPIAYAYVTLARPSVLSAATTEYLVEGGAKTRNVPFPRGSRPGAKPLFFKSIDEISAGLVTYAKTYLTGPDAQKVTQDLAQEFDPDSQRLPFISRLLAQTQPDCVHDVETWLLDVERLLLFGALEGRKKFGFHAPWRKNQVGIRRLILSNHLVIQQLKLIRPDRMTTCSAQLPDFLPHDTYGSFWGRLRFALFACLFARREIALVGGFWHTFRALLRITMRNGNANASR